MSDGVKLAARMWIPKDAEKNPVPALLEYLPYRKRDGTHVRDALTHPYFAGHGYAAIRVDMRGNGDSDGLMLDEYTKQEQDDALEVIAWIARQPWCTGKVGMFGISWGGFNALQVAARKPPALKAIITICSTDDRYEDDIHYKGGTVLNEMLGWAATMLAYSSRPPDPDIVGNKWRKMWMERLEHEPFLAHRLAEASAPRRLLEARLGVRGLRRHRGADAHRRRLERCLFQCHPAADEGPAHHAQGDHRAVGAQVSAFRRAGAAHRLPAGDALRWWDQWLKNEPTGVSARSRLPLLCDGAVQARHLPGAHQRPLAGRLLLGLRPCRNQEVGAQRHTASGRRRARKRRSPSRSKQTTGADGGEYCIIWLGPEFPGDQAQATTSSRSPSIRPRLSPTSTSSASPPSSSTSRSTSRWPRVAVRLNDVWPTGEVSRITYHLQNLCMRDSRETPTALVPGTRYKMKIKLDDIAWRVPKGHKIRVAISTSYFPMMWPAPEPVTLTVYAGKSLLHLPLRKDIANETPLSWKSVGSRRAREDEGAAQVLATSARRRYDEKTGEMRIEIVDDFGEQELKPHGMIISGAGRESYSILPDDPLSAKMETHWTEERRRGTWNTRTETYGRLTATKTHWIVWGKIEAYEGKKKVFEKEFNEKIERKLQ